MVKDNRLMESVAPLTGEYEFEIWDHTSEPMEGDVIVPFAYEEWLCREIGKGSINQGVHIWRHRQGAVLGQRDFRLPQAGAAMRELADQGWSVAVRISGGAFVPLDEGVVNVSLLLPNPEGRMEHLADFQRMVQLLKNTLLVWGLPAEAGEINGAYCPGEYDVAVRGRKFCGIAQRRQLRASAVQAFINVEGSGERLAGIAQRFYETASGGSSELDYPKIERAKTASLSELAADSDMTVGAFVHGLKQRLITLGGTVSAPPAAPESELQTLVRSLRERYAAGSE
ncbi:lipoate--protein ligase family protein [Paenibacillus tarimensis]|uniref:lipoate--protein ligase family protein n=2 Tax=Paenibacillus tarimensis TaxID=416012 RepID=UPI001F4594D2|nr:hypothetical protein [Paenibacillus tarimensis]